MLERIGHYRIVEELGRGGMGVVYKAHEESLNRHVAIKVLGEHLAEDPAYVARFKREAQSAARLTHPNIVQIHLVGEDLGKHYFVMEFVTGSSLQQLLRQYRQMSIQDAARLVLQASAGLAAAHDEGVIHRDIKPANLMIDGRGLLKIADFGLALMREVMNRLTATGMVMGTPGYLAPEQCMEMEVDHRTDIYSLGVTFYEMLAGRMPFEASSPLAMLRMILDVEPPDLQQLNPEVDSGTRAILARMMAKNRDERYDSFHQVMADLQAHLETLVASGIGQNTGPTRQLIAAPLVPPSGPVGPSFDQGDTMGVQKTGSVSASSANQSTGQGGKPPVALPVEPTAAAPMAGSADAPKEKSNLAAIAAVAVFGIVVGVVLFLGIRWFMGRGDEVARNTQQPPAVTATEVPQDGSPVGDPAELDVSDEPVAEAEAEVVIPRATPTRTAKAVVSVPAPTPVPDPVASATPEPILIATAVVEPVFEPEEEPELVADADIDEADELLTQMLEDLGCGDSTKERYAAKKLYRSYRDNPVIYDRVEEVLLASFNTGIDDGQHVDAIAWMCNILGYSGNQKYAVALRKVQDEGDGRKIRGYARKNLKLLE